MENKLDHLSEEEIDILMKDYYNGKNVDEILEEYGVKCRSSMLYKYFPPIILKEYTCEYCGENLVIDRLSKTKKNNKRHEKEAYCLKCSHSPYASNCDCDKCKIKMIELKKKREIEQKESEEIQRNKIIEVYQIDEGNRLDYDELTFTNKVFLGAVLRVLLSEDLSIIYPFFSANRKIAPTDKFLDFIFNELYSNEIISVEPIKSDLKAFLLEDKDFPSVFYKYKVTYYLNLLFSFDKENLIQKFLNPEIYLPENGKEALSLWRKIAVEECIEYLLYQIRSVGFEFSPGDKTYTIFDELLNHFSVSQIYGIIWKSIADASKLYLEKKMPKKQASNSVIGACQRYAERSIINKWKLTEYGRIKELP